MASVPGGQYSFFADGKNVNVVATPDGSSMPPPLAGQFNLELLTSGFGSATPPMGYDGVAMMSPDGKTLTLATGDLGAQVEARALPFEGISPDRRGGEPITIDLGRGFATHIEHRVAAPRRVWAQVDENGREVSHETKIVFKAGEDVAVDFRR